MWRFLHNIPRALKNYHGPRASVGLYVDSDEKDHEAAVKQEKEFLRCVAQSKKGHTCVFKEAKAKRKTILWRLVDCHKHSHTSDQNDADGTNQEDQHHWWNSCHEDIRAFFQGSNQMLDAVAVGTSLLWGTNRKKNNHKHDLIYQVLFSFNLKDEIIKTVTSKDVAPLLLSNYKGRTVLAIKDAAGSEHDQAINQSKSETLEVVLKEFEHMCSDYTAQNESLLGITAADKGNMSEAVKHFRLACSMGNKTACFNLGLCYEQGTGVSRNLEKAKQYYELAAGKGHSQAMYNLSLLYLNADGMEEDCADWEKGMKWMEMAARAGLAQAQKYIGVYHMEETGDTKKAVVYFRAAAMQNDSEAQYFLALCHELGLGVEVNECWAAHLYSLAASRGHDEAICSLARFNEHGFGGIPSDVKAAKELYTKAAKLGNAEAKKRLEELKDLKRKEDQITNIGQVKDTHVSLGSTSTPNLGLMDCSLKDIVYQRLCGFFQTSNSEEQLLFDPGGEINQGKVSFYIGGRDEDELSTGIDINIGGSILSYKCNPMHKSNTTPDLSSTSMLAVDI